MIEEHTMITDKKGRMRLVVTLVILIFVTMSAGLGFLYSENTKLSTLVEEQMKNVTSLQTKLNETRTTLNQTKFILTDVENNTANLLTSNVTPPVSKLKAVDIALSRTGWNSSSLRGMEVDASLSYVRIFYPNHKDEGMGWEDLRSVTQPLDDYSPRVVYNVTDPWGGGPTDKGTMWYRYIWTVTVQVSEGMRGIPPPGLYWVDASTGQLFIYSDIGMVESKP